MPASVRRFELSPADAVTRCPVCGRRITEACVLHGRPPPAPDPDSSRFSGPTGPLFPGYSVKRVVGRGGFGTVFEAEPEGGGPAVAIKLPRADRGDARIGLRHEMNVLADVGPPHVPRLVARGELADGTPYLVMEFLPARTLAERLVGRLEPMTLDDACALVLSILHALEGVHAKGYVHLDLKPENVFVDADLGVTLVDFGLVNPMDTPMHGVESTPAAIGVGTAEYMSPEQCEGRPDLDARADIYAMGVILYELVAGHPPFWGPRTVVKEAHLSRRPPRLSAVVSGGTIPRSVDDLIGRCLAKDRRDRYEGVAALRDALEAARIEVGSPTDEGPTMRSTATLTIDETSPTPAEPAPPPPAPSKGDRPTVGLLFFESDSDAVTVQTQLVSLGGQLAHAAGGRFVAAYGQEHGENPARRALRAAEELIRLGTCKRVRLDLASVAVQTRRDGSKRFVSPLFTRADRFPSDPGPLGLSLTPAASAVVPEASAPPPSRGPKPQSKVNLADLTAEMAGWPMIGRDAILDALVESASRAARDSVPGTAGVIGDAGQGKSHLFRVLLKRLGELGVAEVLALRAREPALGDVDHTLADLLQRVLDLPTAPPHDGGRDLLRERLREAEGHGSVRPRAGAAGSMTPAPTSPHAPRSQEGDLKRISVPITVKPPRPPAVVELADAPTTSPPASGGTEGPMTLAPRSGGDLAPAVALALGWVVPDAPDSVMRPELRALSAAPGALRSALTVAAGGALRRRAARRPLFVVIDDAHFASDVLLSALEYASLAEGGAPLWICALGRPSFERENPSWGERAGRREQHPLGPLDPASAVALCRRLLLPVESVADSAVQRLVDRAQASPLLLVELVRGLRREGIIRKSPKGEAWYLATDELDQLPDLPLVEWLARSELEALAPTLRGHVRLLALAGAEVTIADVEGLLLRLEQEGGDHDFPLDARIATQRLLATGVVLEDRDGRIGFRNVLVRESIARGTPEALRLRIHHAAARYYQSLTAGISEERRLAQLAYHAGEAGMGEVAERTYRLLAERARARHAYTDAERLYSRSLEQKGDESPRDRALAYRGRGLMRYRIARYHDALLDFARAREMAALQGDVEAQIEILLDEATALDWMDDYKTSEERVEQARALLPGVQSPLLEARVLLGVGRSVHRFSRNEEAATLLERAAEAAEMLGDEGYETLVIALMLLGFILPGLARLDDGLRALDRTVALCESHGDRLHLSAATDHRGIVWGLLGDKERMCADMERALLLARELGQSTMELIAEFNFGEMLLLMDDAVAADPHIGRMIAIDRKLSGDPGRPVVALLQARLHLYLGEDALAGAIVARIRERQAEARARGEANPLMVPSEEVWCSMIEHVIADRDAAAWDELEVRAERFSAGQDRIEVTEARAIAAARRGRIDEARHALERALALAGQIPNAVSNRLRRRLAELPSR